MRNLNGTCGVVAAQLAPERYLLAVEGLVDAAVDARLCEALAPLVEVERAAIVVDLGAATVDGHDILPTLVGASVRVASTGGTLTVVTRDTLLGRRLERHEHVGVERQLAGHLL